MYVSPHLARISAAASRRTVSPIETDECSDDAMLKLVPR
jgi:hypothetical protein